MTCSPADIREAADESILTIFQKWSRAIECVRRRQCEQAAHTDEHRIFFGVSSISARVHDKHLQFVLSYETYGGESSDAELIIANFTDAKHDYENTCLIKVGEHEWINKKPTSIKWEHAWFIKVKDMQSRLQSGQYVVKHPPVSTRLMNRIIAGARKTKLLEKPFVRVLRDQFLIPYDNDPVAFDPEPFK